MQKKIFFLILISVFYRPLLSFSQDSIPAVVSLSEDKNIKFQEAFFKALSEKAIYNYQNAIGSLEECNEIIPNNKAVLFELSKNYASLHKYFEAEEFAKKALAKDSDNIWVLEHLVAVYKKSNNFDAAIARQLEIVKKYPKKKEALVFLYLKNNQRELAKKTLQELEDAKLLTSRLRLIKNNLESVKKRKVQADPKIVDKTDLATQFTKDKTFDTLKKLLAKLDQENAIELLAYSQQGMELFPAQPIVYLMNAKALNKKKVYKKALETLQNGIDFVIDDVPLEASFYLEMAIAYKGLGKLKEANKYRLKAKK